MREGGREGAYEGGRERAAAVAPQAFHKSRQSMAVTGSGSRPKEPPPPPEWRRGPFGLAVAVHTLDAGHRGGLAQL